MSRCDDIITDETKVLGNCQVWQNFDPSDNKRIILPEGNKGIGKWHVQVMIVHDSKEIGKWYVMDIVSLKIIWRAANEMLL